MCLSDPKHAILSGTPWELMIWSTLILPLSSQWGAYREMFVWPPGNALFQSFADQLALF